MGSLSRLSLVGALGIALTGDAIAQRSKPKKPADEAWKKDPYTQGKTSAMRKLGYVAFGPFPWGDDHDTRKIHDMMPEAKILWLETAHFRIGSSLGPLKMPKSSKARNRLRAEIKQLAKKLPGVSSKPRVISRWLRLHMYADRLERVYTEWQGRLGVTDRSFPKAGAPVPQDASAYMGRGPFLGMPDKFAILLLKKASNLTRYAVKNGQPMPKEPTPINLNFFDRGSILFGTSSEIVHHSLDPDHSLHSHVIFNTSQMLIRGFKYFSHTLPAWIGEGAANSLVRHHDPEQHCFSGMKDWVQNKAYPKKWDVFARNLAKNGFATGSRKLLAIPQAGQMTFHDQICAWSRVDFLRQLDGGEKFGRFVALLKAQMPHAPRQNPTFETVLAAQEKALQSVFGWSYQTFDAAWTKYALSKYPRR